jgi:hypothetical protein
LFLLVGVDPHSFELDVGLGRSIAVEIDGCEPANLVHYSHDKPTLGGDPSGKLVVVVSDGNRRAYGETEEVLDVVADGLGEDEVGRTEGHGLVDSELDGVGITRRGRKLGWHGIGSGLTDGVFGGPH